MKDQPRADIGRGAERNAMNLQETSSVGRGADSQQRMVRRVCKICGDFEDEHHEPDYLEIPAGCVCDWRTWDYDNKTALPPVCSEYKGNGKENCQTCEHDQACHEPNVPDQR